MQSGREIAELSFAAYGVDFHSPVIQIASPAAQAKGTRFMLYEIPEPDTLHDASYDPSLCGFAIHTDIFRYASLQN
jgi:hypothetical protein